MVFYNKIIHQIEARIKCFNLDCKLKISFFIIVDCLFGIHYPVMIFSLEMFSLSFPFCHDIACPLHIMVIFLQLVIAYV